MVVVLGLDIEEVKSKSGAYLFIENGMINYLGKPRNIE
jgi:hypothetical protein